MKLIALRIATTRVLTVVFLHMALLANAAQPGSVVSWGDQVMPIVQPGTRYTKIAAGFDHSLALKSDGTVVAWGRNDFE